MSAASVALDVAHRVGSTVDRLLERPREVLGALIAAQIAGTVALGLSVAHNGWVWFQGGDQIWITTTGWLVGQLELPPPELGYLWSLALTPTTWVTGPTYVQALPPLILAQILVLGPVALLAVYGIAARIGGRLLGYWAAVLWVVAPYASIPLWVDRYQERWSEQFLPQALGLTAMSDFPSMVLVLVSAYFLVRSLDTPRLSDAILAGLLLGAAGGMKPPNLLMGVGAALAYLVARRWRSALVFGAAAVPGLCLLALWKYRGLGYLPGLSLGEVRLASGRNVGLVGISLDKYFELDLEHWQRQMSYLREFFWSARLAQWVPFAGLLAVIRVRRSAIGGLLAGWLGAFLLVKGFSTRADIQANTFWRLLMPAWPAYLLLLSSIPLLVPTAVSRLGSRVAPLRSAATETRWIVAVAALVLALPAVAIMAASPIENGSRVVLQNDGVNTILTPVDDSIQARVEPSGDGMRVSWRAPAGWRANVFFRVFRYDGTGPDTECEHPNNSRAAYCFLRAEPVGTTRATVFIDPSAPPEASYRIGIGTNWIDDPAAGDVFLLSPPAVASG